MWIVVWLHHVPIATEQTQAEANVTANVTVALGGESS